MKKYRLNLNLKIIVKLESLNNYSEIFDSIINNFNTFFINEHDLLLNNNSLLDITQSNIGIELTDFILINIDDDLEIFTIIDLYNKFKEFDINKLSKFLNKNINNDIVKFIKIIQLPEKFNIQSYEL
jgi:hypothetical protein